MFSNVSVRLEINTCTLSFYTMINIKQNDENVIISAAVTDFTGSIGYCEYTIPLMIKGVKAPPSQATIAGTLSHTKSQIYEKEHTELVPVTREHIQDEIENIEFAREVIFTKLTLPVKISDKQVLLSLSGRIDKVKRQEQTLIVQDDKFVSNPARYEHLEQPYPGQLLQVLTYLNSIYSNTKSKDPSDWWDIAHKHKRWIVQICDKHTQEPVKIFSKIQDSFDLQYLHSSLEKFAHIVMDSIQPEHHNSTAKCNACRYKTVCEFAL